MTRSSQASEVLGTNLLYDLNARQHAYIGLYEESVKAFKKALEDMKK